jgi:hypothetical protein
VTPITVAQLLSEGRLERVAPDIEGAWRRLDEAKRHLDSSATLASTDPSLAYVALYDAARKALVAHMEANGYRPTNRPGAHQAVGIYGEATVATRSRSPERFRFDRRSPPRRLGRGPHGTTRPPFGTQ